MCAKPLQSHSRNYIFFFKLLLLLFAFCIVFCFNGAHVCACVCFLFSKVWPTSSDPSWLSQTEFAFESILLLPPGRAAMHRNSLSGVPFKIQTPKKAPNHRIVAIRSSQPALWPRSMPYKCIFVRCTFLPFQNVSHYYVSNWQYVISLRALLHSAQCAQVRTKSLSAKLLGGARTSNKNMLARYCVLLLCSVQHICVFLGWCQAVTQSHIHTHAIPCHAMRVYYLISK